MKVGFAGLRFENGFGGGQTEIWNFNQGELTDLSKNQHFFANVGIEEGRGRRRFGTDGDGDG
jgi:hypothetical protein